jgi:tripartite-type tricarboxylate transporter receptor subunit TctC
MPGAAGLKELAYTYNAAPKDGSVIDLAHQEVLQESILNEKARFDARKFNWIGRFVDVDYIGVVTARSGVKSIDDARKKQIVAGATGARGASAIGPELFNRTAGTKFKVVAGYKGTDEMFLAQEKGEVDMVTATWVIVRAAHADAFKSGKLIPICAMALERIPDLPNVPTITEFGSDPAVRTFVRIWAAGGTVGRALATPPGVPAERVQALRTAFDRMLADPAFKADIDKHKTPFNPMSGEKLAQRIQQVATLSPAEIASSRKLYAALLSSKSAKGKRK